MKRFGRPQKTVVGMITNASIRFTFEHFVHRGKLIDENLKTS